MSKEIDNILQGAKEALEHAQGKRELNSYKVDILDGYKGRIEGQKNIIKKLEAEIEQRDAVIKVLKRSLYDCKELAVESDDDMTCDIIEKALAQAEEMLKPQEHSIL